MVMVMSVISASCCPFSKWSSSVRNDLVHLLGMARRLLTLPLVIKQVVLQPQPQSCIIVLSSPAVASVVAQDTVRHGVMTLCGCPLKTGRPIYVRFEPASSASQLRQTIITESVTVVVTNVMANITYCCVISLVVVMNILEMHVMEVWAQHPVPV